MQAKVNIANLPRKVMMLAMALAVAAALMLALNPREAHASHSGTFTTIKGTVVQWNPNGSSSKGADYTVKLYRWNGSSWGSPVKTTTANSYGQYTFSYVPTGHYYYVSANKAAGDCYYLGYYEHFQGNTNTLTVPTTSTGVNATVNTYYLGRVYCQ